MKNFSHPFLLLGILVSLVAISSCNSNNNVFTYMDQPNDGKENVTVRILLSAAATRAGENTPDPEEIKIVNLYVFDGNDVLESIHPNVAASANTPVDIKIYSPGRKKIYAVSARQLFNAQIGLSLSEFENKVFDSTMSDLISDVNGFVMIGVSNVINVETSSGSDNIPQSNILRIDMYRLVAKTQLAYASLDDSSFGFSVKTPIKFTVFQTNNKMRVVSLDEDIHSYYTDDDEYVGTYDQYSVGGGEYIEAQGSAFTDTNCKYMSENKVSDPISGNTTFMGVKIPLVPDNYYSYNSSTQQLTSTPNSAETATTFYAVGIVDTANGLVDYVVDASSPSHKTVIVFNDEDDAKNYTAALNGGETPGMTVSQTETPLQAPRRKAEGAAGTLPFKTLTFTGGLAYYRINIGETVSSQENGEETSVFKPMVQRNKFYKVNLTKINNLGLPEESLLIPENAEAVLDNQMSSWINCTFNVVGWEPVEQNVDL